ncbi:MAG TPA: cytochrome c oxidase assembly protein [Solirubrobacteraceae bacterium]
MHLGEFVPPLGATLLYLLLYRRRLHSLAAQGRRVPAWRRGCFWAGALALTVVQLPPLDGLADGLLVAHMLQHIVIGDVASLLIVLGLTGPVLAPLLRMRYSRLLRWLSHPLVAVTLWALDLYAWHLPVLYQLAIRHDLVHALEHACMLWFGALLWLAVIGPLPKPAWFRGWGEVGYLILVRFLGAVLANALIWGQSVFYPVYRSPDAARGLSPLSDQNLAGGVMMIEQILLTTAFLVWLFARLMRRDEQRQSLLDISARRGVPLAAERAERAAAAGPMAADRLRERLLREAHLEPENKP